jgi:hypothetical protein
MSVLPANSVGRVDPAGCDFRNSRPMDPMARPADMGHEPTNSMSSCAPTQDR